MIDLTEILGAIQSRLTSDAPLTSIVPTARIGNFLPQGAAYPHIFYQIEGEVREVKGETGFSVTLQFDVWSKAKGSKECLQIVSLIEDAIDGQPLTISSGNCYGAFLVSFDSSLEPSGDMYRGTAVYTLLYGAS